MCGSPRTMTSACLVVLVLFAGCGPTRPAVPSISGVVTWEGEPLSGGRVALFGSGDAVASAEIQPDGSFLIARVAPGPVQVSIAQLTRTAFVPQHTDKDADALKHPMSKYKPVVQAHSGEVPRQELPEHYADPQRSGLSFTVMPGTQTHDFHLGIHGTLADRPPGSISDPALKLGLRVGQLAPDIEGEDLDGRSFSLRGYRGQVVVLTFWGHW